MNKEQARDLISAAQTVGYRFRNEPKAIEIMQEHNGSADQLLDALYANGVIAHRSDKQAKSEAKPSTQANDCERTTSVPTGRDCKRTTGQQEQGDCERTTGQPTPSK
jgi:hypothetical protein